MANRPRLLLLDEPMAAIDVSARAELRRVLRGALDGFEGVGVLVTHDPVEAFSTGERIAVMEGGSIVQEGTVAEVASRPRSSWSARMMGLNLFRGRATNGTVRVAPGAEMKVASGLEGDVFAAVAPRAVALHREHPEGSPRNVWMAEAQSLDLEGERVRVSLVGPVSLVAEVTPAAVAELRLGEGGPVWCTFKATDVDVYPA
jgi:ABC-type sulfate/molybdate transport systems ATPase subunit